MEINKVYQGDSAKLMKEIPSNFIDLTVTSPPYDNLRDYKGYSFDFETIAKELYRVTKDGGVVVWVVGDATINGSETGTSFKQALYFKEIGFNLHDTMIYAKNNPIPLTHNRYEQQFEYMFVFSKGRPTTFNPIKIPTKTFGSSNNHKSEKHYEDNHSMRKRNYEISVKGLKYLYNIWFLTVGMNDKVEHNAPFPEQLAKDHIISWSNEGDLIFDPFSGSGTTLKMAKLNKRNYLGFEIAEEYISLINKRLSQEILVGFTSDSEDES